MTKYSASENAKFFFQSMLFYNLEALKGKNSKKPSEMFHIEQDCASTKRWIRNEGDWQITFEECCEQSGLDSDKVRGSLEQRRLV